MGYTTEFRGSFKFDKPLDQYTKRLINGLNQTRRVKRDLTKLGMTFKEAIEFGIEGEFFIEGKGFMGQDRDASVLDNNTPPINQPGLWCNWCYNEKENCIEWDGCEKFYYYIPWIKYLIECVLEPNYILNGEVEFVGEEEDDAGIIKIENNIITVIDKQGEILNNYNHTQHTFNDLFSHFFE